MATDFSEETLSKARRLLDQGRLRPDEEHRNIWWAESLTSDHTYRVQADYREDTGAFSWVTCTCPGGLHTGGQPRCYHAAAVVMLLRAQGANAEDPLW